MEVKSKLEPSLLDNLDLMIQLSNNSKCILFTAFMYTGMHADFLP